MRKLFAALLITSIALPLRAAPSGQPAPAKPAAEQPAKQRSFLQRLFGSKPKPTPAPTPAPVVKTRLKPKAKPAPGDMPVEVQPKATAKVAPKTSTSGKAGTKKGTPAPAVTPALDEATRFKNAKAKALEDAKIAELKGKADGEVNETEAHKALVSYNRALFQKIREIDPSVSDYAGKVEQSMTKRLGAEKGKE